MKTEYQDEKKELKAKKIRKILLLKIDRELKSDSNKKLNIMINSKPIQDLNKEYNSYKILLSETTRIYSNYVEMVEKSYPNNTRQIKTKRDFPRKQNEEQTIKSLNSSFESQSHYLEYIPNKIDLGEKRFIPKRKEQFKNLNSPDFDFFKQIKLMKGSPTNEHMKNKSTKINNKGIVKVIDKIIRLKLQTDEDDNNITKSIMKLRKYCYKLIKKKKKLKKNLNPKSQSPKKLIKRQKYKKRKTIVGTNPLIKISLFGLKENNKEENVKRKETFKKVTIFLNPDLIEKNNDINSRNKMFPKNIKDYKISSFKAMKSMKEKEKEKINSDRKRKLRRVQTMSMNKMEQDIIKVNENKKPELKKNRSTIDYSNKVLKESLISTKFSRPTKFLMINNNNKIFRKKNSLFDNKSIKLKKDKSNSKYNEDKKDDDIKRKNKARKSFLKNVNHTIKFYNNSSIKKFKIFSDA